MKEGKVEQKGSSNEKKKNKKKENMAVKIKEQTVSESGLHCYATHEPNSRFMGIERFYFKLGSNI